MISNSNQCRLTFGKGDIDLVVFYADDKSYIIAENTDMPGTIGSFESCDGQYMTPERMRSAPIIMSFENEESIDAVITALRIARFAFRQMRQHG